MTITDVKNYCVELDEAAIARINELPIDTVFFTRTNTGKIRVYRSFQQTGDLRALIADDRGTLVRDLTRGRWVTLKPRKDTYLFIP